MKVSKSVVFVSFLFFVFLQFSSGKDLKINCRPSFDTIIFGSGGGFTGMVKSYIIDKSGSIKSQREKKIVGNFSKKDFKKLCQMVKSSGIETLSFNKPGNFYYFIEIKKGGSTIKVTWNDSDKAPEKILQLYKYLSDHTNALIK